MKQQTSDWLRWRDAGIGSSDAPIIVGDSPWATPYQLWERKTGRRSTDAKSLAMLRGLALEPQARAAYEAYTGNVMEPHCRAHPQHDFMRASLDGLSFDEDLILEIKCAGREDHEQIQAGRVPQKYVAQIQHQLGVTGASACHLWSYDGTQGALLEVAPAKDYIEDLVTREQSFWAHVQNDEPPPLNERDVRLRDDPEWQALAAQWLQSQELLRQAQAWEESVRQRLEAMAGSGTTLGGGIRVSKSYRKGAIDYGRIPSLAGLDLEPYRKRGKRVFTIQRLKPE